jgi:hypothetical protein
VRVDVAFWVTGADERERFKKLKPSARLLYIDVGAWVQEQHFNNHRDELPDEWFVPSSIIRDMGGKNYTGELTREGLFRPAERDGLKGFVIVAINYRNTPDYIRAQRDRYQREHARKKRARARRIGGENRETTWG